MYQGQALFSCTRQYCLDENRDMLCNTPGFIPKIPAQPSHLQCCAEGFAVSIHGRLDLLTAIVWPLQI